MSRRPIITSVQLSITWALMLRRMLCDFVTSLKKVKSKTTSPYIKLQRRMPAKNNDDDDVSKMLSFILEVQSASVLSLSRCLSNHLATSLLTKEVYAHVSNRVSAVK
jgi:hypothetical protein